MFRSGFYFILTGCSSSVVKTSDLKPVVIESETKFSVSGFGSKVDGNNILVGDNYELKLYDLISKKHLMSITIPEK